MKKIVVNTDAKAQRVDEEYKKAVSECKRLAKMGIDRFRITFKVADSSEMDEIINRMEKEYGLRLSSKTSGYNGYVGDFKSWILIFS